MGCMLRFGICLALTAAASAQTTGSSRFLNTKEWTGTFSVVTSYSGASGGTSAKVLQVSNGTIQFTPEPNQPGSWIGTVSAMVSWSDDYVLAFPDCTMFWTNHTAGPQTATGHFRISGNSFSTFADPSEIEINMPTMGSCPATGPYGEVMLWYLESTYPLPATGSELKGSQSFPPTSIGPSGIIPPNNATTVSWDFFSDAQDVEVIISAAGYDTWRPQAAVDTSPGNNIVFTALLQNKDGTTPATRATRFKYELVERSSVPGIAMNYPPASKAMTDPDLQITPASNPTLTVSGSFGQQAVSANGSYLTSPPVTVNSFDWGGYGKLRITAVLSDGTEVIGHLKNSSEQDARIPKRSADSAIADQWKIDTGTTGKIDLDDSEVTPGGDGHPGDGLSLYEEYRGFYVNGARVEGDPAKKELFVNDRTNEQYGALTLYSKLTGIQVHSGLLISELSDVDVNLLNFNYDDSRHKTDQHGLTIWNQPGRTGSAVTVALRGQVPGTPKNVFAIALPDDLLSQGPRLVPGPTISYAYAAQTLVHEMLHASNVYHHGEEDVGLTWTSPLPAVNNSVTALENGNPVMVRLESPEGDTRGPKIGDGSTWNVGVFGGQNSGEQECVMRYTDAGVYDFKHYQDGANRLMVFPQQQRTSPSPDLCRSARGTGINDAVRIRSFGDASCGNCFAQFCINDFYNHSQVCPK